MKKQNKREIEKELKKIKPIELKKEDKEEKKEEAKKIINPEFREDFHESLVWPSSEFIPEQLSFQNKVERLEEFAETLPSTPKITEEISYAPTKPSGESYTPSSDYISDKKYQTSEKDTRPAPILDARRGFDRDSLISPLRSTGILTSNDFAKQRQEFERQQEQYRPELREKSKLPFQREKRKTEIF